MRDSPARPIFEDPDLAPKDAAAHVIKCISDYKPDLITPSVLMQCPPDVQLLEAGLGNWILNGYEFWGAEKKIGFRAPMAGVAVIALPLEAMAAVPITVGVAAVSGAGAVLANAAVPVVHGARSSSWPSAHQLELWRSFLHHVLRAQRHLQGQLQRQTLPRHRQLLERPPSPPAAAQSQQLQPLEL
eukprot:Transcript_4600.p1 GENE.Transcript_4600~~Transcript_4600.p1  ORF type:complete len:186 (-),score=4.48 Transcript_4600:16-573(-)